MARQIFRKFLPTRSAIENNRVLRLFGLSLIHGRFWTLNRHSVAFGVATGFGFAFIAAPIQVLGATLTAMLGRGNVPLAMTATWLSNPLTWGPCFWAAYEVGLWFTPAERIEGFTELREQAMQGGIFGGAWELVKFIGSNLHALYPMYVGGIILGGIVAVITYFAIILMWRWTVTRRWYKRHAERLKLNPQARLNSGLAHLYRHRAVH